jgi:glycosyltransferase involved in cell wall biosynthesis
MRLLFHAPGLFVPTGVYGAAVTLRLLRRQLARDGHETAVLVHDADVAGDGGVMRHADPLAALPQAARDFTADAVIVMTGQDVAAAIDACRAARLPTALYVQTVDMTQHDLALGRADVLHLAVSAFAADRLRAWSGVAAAVVPPIVEPAEDAEDAPRDRVLFVNPIPEKGCEIAFALMRELRHVPFIVLESWPLPDAWRSYCLTRVAAFGNVDWRTPTDDMNAVWQRTRAVLMPSIAEETWGRVAGEAQARGIPVIASTRGALADTVGPGGLLLDVHGPLDAWIGAVERLASDDRLHRRLAEAARSHAARAQAEAPARLLIAALQAHVARCAA